MNNSDSNVISERQAIQDLLSQLEKSTTDKNLFQQLVVLLKKNSKVILQFVSENLNRFLDVLETEIETNEVYVVEVTWSKSPFT